MNASAEILIIGPGRLGRCMARWLHQAGRSVRLIGRGEAIPRAPLTWLTVPDRSIATVAQAVPDGGALLHASGAVGLDPLEPHPIIGSLHPLMTFTGEEERSQMPSRIPAAISGNEAARAAAEGLAHALGFDVFEFDGDRRLYHAAAVLSGNFATVLLARGAELLESQGIHGSRARQILAPLAIQSIQNAAHAAPEHVLTGPVARGDHQVIQSHIEAMTEIIPEHVDLYKALLCSAGALMSSVEQSDD